MPAYMDNPEHVEGLAGRAAAGAHDVQCLGHWYDEGSGRVFCLVEAADEEAAAAVHREAHRPRAGATVPVQEVA